MKIGILCHDSCGGSTRIAVCEACELARKGHEVHLFSKTTPFIHVTATAGLFQHTLSRTCLKSNRSSLEVVWPEDEMESMVRLISDVVSAKGLQVLHVHYALPLAYIALEVKTRLPRPGPALVATLHGSEVSVFGRDPLVGLKLTRALKTFDALTTVSASHARLAGQVLNLETDPMVIPNFLDLDFYPAKAPVLSGPKPRIIHISNFRWLKDPQGIARIFAAVRTNLEAELWLVGHGEAMAAVERYLKHHHLQGEVRFFGLHRDVAAVLGQADLLLMNSRLESFCLAALEAMACGLPVVASKVGGLPEVVGHQRTGFLFPRNDDETAAGYVLRLLSEPGLYRSMSLAAREQASRFDQKTVVPLYERLYDRVSAERLIEPQRRGD